MAKWFHIPTFAVHGLLLLSAACTINHYHDFFLFSSLMKEQNQFLKRKEVRKWASPYFPLQPTVFVICMHRIHFVMHPKMHHIIGLTIESLAGAILSYTH